LAVKSSGKLAYPGTRAAPMSPFPKAPSILVGAFAAAASADHGVSGVGLY